MILVPTAKRERAVAMVDHLLTSGAGTEFSRLSLSVVAGTLQAMVEATPRCMGQTYLHHLHSLVRPAGQDLGTGLQPYCSKTSLTTEVREELSWWQLFLEGTKGRRVRGSRAATLVPSFGDGSGTGTGGTIRIPEQALKMWKGTWSVLVCRFLSNYKELATLKLTLEQLLAEPREDIEETTIFYFTNNSATYFIMSAGSSKTPRLHALVREIKRLEILLGVFVNVVHVPGLVMIQQGTDGLSRGIWMTRLNAPSLNQDDITQAIFAPVHVNYPWLSELIHHLLGGISWSFRRWDQPWVFEDCVDKLTVWTPPPEIARQVMQFLLEVWCEKPLTTSALVLVPRTLIATWRGLSRHFQEIHTIYPLDTPIDPAPLLPIPVVVMHLAPHTRSLPTPHRMDRPTLPPNARWHREQASQMRGLHPRSLNPTD